MCGFYLENSNEIELKFNDKNKSRSDAHTLQQPKKYSDFANNLKKNSVC